MVVTLTPHFQLPVRVSISEPTMKPRPLEKIPDEIRGRPADGGGEVEEHEHPTPGETRVEIGDDRRRDDGIRGLSDADHPPEDKEQPEHLKMSRSKERGRPHI